MQRFMLILTIVLIESTLRPLDVHAEISNPINADSISLEKLLCPDADFWGKKMLTGVCWSCLFPIRLFGATIFDGVDNGDVPDGVSERALCSCSEKNKSEDPLLPNLPSVGLTAGAWLPARLIEVVRKPYCSPILGGKSLNTSVRLWGGRKETNGDGSDKTYYNYHFWAFPLYAMLQLFVQTRCNPGGLRNLDMMYMSEFDPTWNIDELAFFLNPEAVLFANPLAMSACTVDCATTTASKPLNSLFWCAGCWGNLYPFSGNIASDASPPRDTSLLAARVLASLHRKGLAHKTYGQDSVCNGEIYPMLPKQQYKLSMLFPLTEGEYRTVKVPNVDSTGTPITESGHISTRNVLRDCCHYIGESPFFWGEHATVPGVGEDYVYLIFRYTDCCIGIFGEK